MPKTKLSKGKQLARRLKRLAFHYAQAWCELRWKGRMDPEDWPVVERRHHDARRKLMDEIDNTAVLIDLAREHNEEER
jgi:hypothetical protein